MCQKQLYIHKLTFVNIISKLQISKLLFPKYSYVYHLLPVHSNVFVALMWLTNQKFVQVLSLMTLNDLNRHSEFFPKAKLKKVKLLLIHFWCASSSVIKALLKECLGSCSTNAQAFLLNIFWKLKCACTLFHKDQFKRKINTAFCSWPSKGCNTVCTAGMVQNENAAGSRADTLGSE